MSRLVACLLAAALVTWGLALLREACALISHHERERRLRRAAMPAWLTARRWWSLQAGLLTVLVLLSVGSLAVASWWVTLALVTASVLATCGPSLWLHWRIRQRRRAMRRELPGLLMRLCLATQCLAPFEEALQLAVRWGPDGPLAALLQRQLLNDSRWPRPRAEPTMTPLVTELLQAAQEARRGALDRDQQLRQWQWLLVRSLPAATAAYDPRRRHFGAPADAASDAEVTS